MDINNTYGGGVTFKIFVC